jgi:3-oxoacyl-[acyl-carrier protein] reductase
MFEGLKDKKVLITGASSGIGASIAELFAAYKADLGIHYFTGKERAEKIQEAIKKQGGKSNLFKCDLLDKSLRSSLISEFIEVYGGIDVLVNNAGGVYGNVNFVKLDEGSWNKTLDLNLTAPFLLSRDAFSFMKSHNGGKIINISSISAKYGGSAKTMHYGAAKAALESITRGLAKSGAPHNILVNAIRGGVIDTPFHEKIKRSQKILSDRINLIPLKRMGAPIDIARMALFLASEAGDFITGEIFTIAGGD